MILGKRIVIKKPQLTIGQWMVYYCFNHIVRINMYQYQFAAGLGLDAGFLGGQPVLGCKLQLWSDVFADIVYTSPIIYDITVHSTIQQLNMAIENPSFISCLAKK